MRAWARFAGSALFLLVLTRPDAVPAEPGQNAAPRTTIHWSSGYGQGVGGNRRIRKVETRWGADYRIGAPLSVGVELALLRFVGVRDEHAVDCAGATLFPVVAWHFWRSGNASLAFDLGLGAAVFYPAFPPGGTMLNGYSAVGLQARLPLRRDVSLLLGLRALHHSNGRGVVTQNPAFDGLAVNIGAGFGVGP